MFKYSLPLLLALLLCSCGDEAKEQKNSSVAGGIAATDTKSEADPGTVARATALIGFANHAKETLSKGYHSLPDAMAANTRIYLETWRLPPRPRRPRKDSAAFSLPAGMFNADEAEELEKAYGAMDKALSNLLGYYANLEKYVADKSIIDDGEKGRGLAAKIGEAHSQFLAARQDWLAIVDKRAAEAERVLLAGHPLERQINAAQAILAQFREVSLIMTQENPDREMLQACAANLKSFAREGGKSPFPARPALERLYREFLKSVNNYIYALERAVQYGCHTGERRNINIALLACQKDYNIFAREANASSLF